MNWTLLRKEARELAWPWFGITFVGALSLTRFSWAGTWLDHSWVELILWCGAVMGVPLLATLPLGSEFQHRTLALSLSQPRRRQDFWRLKFMVTLVAVLPAALLYCIGVRLNWPEDDQLWLAATALMILAAAGSIFWTLLGRSIMGGLVLNWCFVGLFEVATQFEGLHLKPVSRPWLWATGASLAACAGGMVWLGRRKLISLEAVEGMQAADTVIPGTQFVPRFVVKAFRSRPTGLYWNLVRREVYLLRVVWPLSLLAVLGWITVLTLFAAKSRSQDIGIGFSALTCALIAVLAGTLSLGEEKSWGTHSWHLTLPVSGTVQWLVKLLVAVLTSLLAAAVLPISAVLVACLVKGFPIDRLPVWTWPVEIIVLTLLSFLCACMVKGLVRAALWVFPLGIAIGVGVWSGSWMVNALGLRAGSFLEAIIWKLDPIAVNGMLTAIFNSTNRYQLGFFVVLVPLLVVGLVQSRRLFRAQAEDTKMHVLRSALPLVVTALLCGFAVEQFECFALEAWKQQALLVRETHRAIATLQPGSAGTGSLQLAGSDLAKASPLSEHTRNWLAGASIVVTPERFYKVNAGTFPPGWGSSKRFSVFAPVPASGAFAYSVVIQRGSGQRCEMNFSASEHARDGILNWVCE